MEPLHTINRWTERLRDRERVGSFARFMARRFLDDRLFLAAAALSYTTVFALVPLAMVVFGVLSAFPMFAEWREQLTDYVFSNFVPSAANAVKDKLFEFLGNSGKLTVAGAIGLIVSLLITLNSIEGTFNRIWRVSGARPRLSRFLVYWTVLTLGALLAAASLALSAWIFALPLLRDTVEGKWLSGLALRSAPVLIELLAIAAIYRVVPHRTVQLRYAFAGALVATLLLEAIKWGLGLYLSTFNAYEKLYGALAALPILLLWIYLCWVAVLLGASFASAISAFRYQPASMRLPAGYEIYGLLRLLGRFDQARAQGRGLHVDEMLELEPILTDSLVQQFIDQLSDIGLLRRAENGEWLLARDIDTLVLAELYEACQLRIPVAEAQLPHRDDVLGQAALAALNDLRIPLRELLKRNVHDLYAHTRETNP
ncbi:MAG: YihY family inner membrane protein [Pseudoxanthomonas sp.]